MSYKAGDKLPEIIKDPIAKVQLVMYAGASGDFNPIHTDDEAAQARGLKGVIAHGMLSMGFLGQLAEAAFGAGSTRKLEVNFRGMVDAGEIITLRGEVTEVREESGRQLAVCEIEAVNSAGDTVTNGMVEAWMG
ncbi:MAG: dehydratase [Nitrospinaceae bacterium]|jgi:acyl dehydratase|nr:dehydratase [Nitrospinaceae bacterium]MBT3820700.1 dehydratase [Nitrospinaceae bacterium]MBT4095285.1 dehydratase [Nitrospinaceae bacterium]MBT4429090.1 dehydratase [Nitrospinaceae bacterium]MBT5366911.1 dehydratase [Nitrospinaceae bacterium]